MSAITWTRTQNAKDIPEIIAEFKTVFQALNMRESKNVCGLTIRGGGEIDNKKTGIVGRARDMTGGPCRYAVLATSAFRKSAKRAARRGKDVRKL